MNKKEYFEFSDGFFQNCINISKAKNADYTGGTEDTFANFTIVGEEWTEIGFYTRMMDKMQRVRSFIKNGDLQVKSESVEDALTDLANYSSLFAGYLRHKKQKLDEEQQSS